MRADEVARPAGGSADERGTAGIRGWPRRTVTHEELLTLRRNLAGGTPPESVRPSVLAGAAGAAGTALGLVFAVTALLRRSKPLHPVGIVATAHLTVTPAPTTSGSPVLDEPGEHECQVRASHAVGTGPKHADIEGFALRLLLGDVDRATADVLFASTGVGPLGRHVLTVRSPGEHAAQTTLLPVRAEGRALYLCLDPLDARSQPWPTRYQLSWAHGRGAWRPFGILTVAWGMPADAAVRFDPVAHPLPGTSQYRVVARVREPAYRLARLAWPRAGRLTAPRDLRESAPGGEIRGGRALEPGSVGGEPGAVQWAVPAALGVVPRHDAAQVGADRADGAGSTTDR